MQARDVLFSSLVLFLLLSLVDETVNLSKLCRTTRIGVCEGQQFVTLMQRGKNYDGVAQRLRVTTYVKRAFRAWV